jgi:hypothetical protein
MTDEQNKENEERPKIHVVDRRGISEENQANNNDDNSAPPKLEMISGGASKDAPREEASAEADEDEDEISEEEARQMQTELEEQQFEAISKQMGRPLTEKEKDSVRQEMQRQAETAMRLEVSPLLVQTMSELSGRAAVHLGLMPNPYTRLVARNDKEARIAIDAFGALYEVIKFSVEGTLNKELARVLNDLKANYANITGKPIADQGGPKLII